MVGSVNVGICRQWHLLTWGSIDVGIYRHLPLAHKLTCAHTQCDQKGIHTRARTSTHMAHKHTHGTEREREI